jgi:hypothetical protein
VSPKPQRTRPAPASAIGRPALQPAVEQLNVGAPPPPPAQPLTQVVTESQTLEETDSQTPVAPERAPARPARPRRPAEPELPRWQTFVRKEARVWPDQADQLAQLRRRLLGRRQQREETITDNTLIRVAVDLLLQHQDKLQGSTEDELRASLGLKRRQ